MNAIILKGAALRQPSLKQSGPRAKTIAHLCLRDIRTRVQGAWRSQKARFIFLRKEIIQEELSFILIKKNGKIKKLLIRSQYVSILSLGF
jgi:hypothetical protein